MICSHMTENDRPGPLSTYHFFRAGLDAIQLEGCHEHFQAVPLSSIEFSTARFSENRGAGHLTLGRFQRLGQTNGLAQVPEVRPCEDGPLDVI